MTKVKLLSGFFACSLLFSCSKNLSGFSQYEPMNNELKDAPKWVYSEVGEYEEKASAKIVQNNFELARSEALLKAKARLAERIKSSINKRISERIKKSSHSGSTRLKEKLDLFIEQTTDMILVDVKEKAIWISRNGNVWVLVKANPKVVDMLIQHALSAFLEDSKQAL